MSKIIVIILFTCVVICTGLSREQEPSSEDRYGSEEDKYESESKQDFGRTAEKELKLLRKAKKLKETNYRRALESILPVKSSQSYRRLFEDLINSSKEHSKSLRSSKEIEEVVVTDSFLGENESEGRDGEPQVEEIEVVIERISDDENAKDGNNNNNEPSLVSRDSSSYEPTDQPFQEKHSRDGVIESIAQEEPLKGVDVDEDLSGRTAQDSSVEKDDKHLGNKAQHTVIESYPVNRVSEVVIPHYRTALTRSGVVVSPAVYTVKTSTPIVDHVTTRSWGPNRPVLPDIYGRSSPRRSDLDTTFIDDYKDTSRNAYRYTPSPSRQLFTHWPGDLNMGILPKMPADALQPQLGMMKPFRDNFHAGTFYPQPQRFYPNTYRPMFNFHR